MESHHSFTLHPLLFINEFINEITVMLIRICSICMPIIVYIPVLSSGLESCCHIGVDKTTQFIYNQQQEFRLENFSTLATDTLPF